MIVSQERENLDEDAGLFSTCTSYSQSSDGDAKLSDSQLEVSLTDGTCREVLLSLPPSTHVHSERCSTVRPPSETKLEKICVSPICGWRKRQIWLWHLITRVRLGLSRDFGCSAPTLIDPDKRRRLNIHPHAPAHHAGPIEKWTAAAGQSGSPSQSN